VHPAAAIGRRFARPERFRPGIVFGRMGPADGPQQMYRNHRQVHGQDAIQSGTGIEILPSRRRSGGLIRAQSPAILQTILPRSPPVFQVQRFLG
jgi:hypothetical protein